MLICSKDSTRDTSTFTWVEFSGIFSCKLHATLQTTAGEIIHQNRARFCANTGNFLFFEKTDCSGKILIKRDKSSYKDFAYSLIKTFKVSW